MSGPPIENVHECLRPPRLEGVLHCIRIRLGDRTIADMSCALREFETYHAPTYYLPPGDVTADLVPVGGGCFCEWKSCARHFDVHADGIVGSRATWSYDAPSHGFADLAGHLASYAGLMTTSSVGGEPMIPQPGDFYGGWVTANLRGRPKRARGPGHW